MIPEREGEKRYQADHVATAVRLNGVLGWSVRNITMGTVSYTECLAHDSHWQVKP
jgi:hypothetical protein